MIQINSIVLALIVLFAVGVTLTEICLNVSECGFRHGYEKGLEDGIRLTNEAVSEEATQCDE